MVVKIDKNGISGERVDVALSLPQCVYKRVEIKEIELLVSFSKRIGTWFNDRTYTCNQIISY